MRVLWFTWKDIKHPWAGGAEVVTSELLKRLAADGHEVEVVTSRAPGAPERETIDGYLVVRGGGRFSVYWHALRYYCRHRRGWADVVIDEMNTLPFFTKFYIRHSREGGNPAHFLFVHQLCREIWFYQMRFPVSLLGYLLEPLWLRALSGMNVITVSESTKRDLMRYGFHGDLISVVSEGIRLAPVADLTKVKKGDPPVMLVLGSIRPMKRTKEMIRAFELSKRARPDLRLVVAGPSQGNYGRETLRMMGQSPYRADIEYAGVLSEEGKAAAMRSASVATFASVKEGWCLVVTEAASQGTPAVVYDVDGLRDSVRDGETGLVCRRNTPEAMAEAVVRLLNEPQDYAKMRAQGWKWSQEINPEQCYVDFLNAVEK